MAASASTIDWRRLAGLAMTRLGWPPEVFWAATPADLAAALAALAPAGPPAAAPMTVDELADLRARFPDGPVDADAGAGR